MKYRAIVIVRLDNIETQLTEVHAAVGFEVNSDSIGDTDTLAEVRAGMVDLALEEMPSPGAPGWSYY